MKEEATVTSYYSANPVVDVKGNVDYESYIEKFYLQDDKGNKISRDYLYLEPINNDDHYIIGDFVTGYGIDYLYEIEERKASFKFGIICLQRDYNGSIIPMSEKLVVPLVYDRITENNLATVTAYANNNHLTYVDVDPNSENYGKQLVPAVLDHAVAFNVEFEGFAECGVSDVTGYLPRDCQPLTELRSTDLLTKQQVEDLLSNKSDGAKTLNLKK